MDDRSDTRSGGDKPDTGTPGGQSQQNVEHRPNVSTTTPDKYPDKASGKDV